jgi:uncharacterized protein (DUF1778 family)
MARKKAEANGEAPPLTGGAYLKAKGLKPVVVGVTPEEHALLVRASSLTGTPRNLAKYIVARAVEAARRDIADDKNNS